MNEINTWQQGQFVDNPRYNNWTEQEKDLAETQEECLVRPQPTGNAICRTFEPEDAKWIARRLNRAANLEKRFREYFLNLQDVQRLGNISFWTRVRLWFRKEFYHDELIAMTRIRYKTMDGVIYIISYDLLPPNHPNCRHNYDWRGFDLFK